MSQCVTNEDLNVNKLSGIDIVNILQHWTNINYTLETTFPSSDY